MSASEHYQEALKILADMKQVERGSAADQSMLTEALIHAVLAVADAIELVPGAMP
jgi:hypothetical protein